MRSNIHTVESFLGVNRKATETLLKLGEASDCVNWFITDDRKLQKMYGYEHLFTSLGEHKINGMWYGSLSGTEYLLFACNGHVYEHNLTTGANTDLGTLKDAYPTTFWVTNNTVYIMDGDEFYSWAGTGNITTVTGYVPTVLTASPPSGGGTILESMNYISGAKIQKFSGDGMTTVYQLAEYDVDSIDEVYVNGVLQTLTSDYTVNLTNGTVIFDLFPPSGTNNVTIKWTKIESGDRELITNNRYFGGVYYARFWLYGNANHKNTRYVSGVTMAGLSDPTYWPKFADSDVGEYEISGIVTQYDKQIIFTSGNDSEASAWYSTETTYLDSATGIITTMFPVYPMNAKVGNVAMGQVQIVMNNPVTIWKGLYEWVATNVVNEKNARWISEYVQNDLDTEDLKTALAIDWSDKGQYWLCIGDKVWVNNYRVGAWHKLELAHTPTCFEIVDSKLCFGTTDGYLMMFDENLKTYDGETITAVWKMGYHNFSAEWIEKFIKRMFISILPRIATHVDITYQTDRNGGAPEFTVSYALTTFDHMNFAKFTFKTNYGPQPFEVRLRAKKFDFFKLILTNDGTDTATVLSLTFPVLEAGEVKRRH